MPNFIDYDYNQVKILPVSYGKQIIPGTFEHTLSYIIDYEMDLSVFNENYKNDDHDDWIREETVHHVLPSYYHPSYSSFLQTYNIVGETPRVLATLLHDIPPLCNLSASGNRFLATDDNDLYL